MTSLPEIGGDLRLPRQRSSRRSAPFPPAPSRPPPRGGRWAAGRRSRHAQRRTRPVLDARSTRPRQGRRSEMPDARTSRTLTACPRGSAGTCTAVRISSSASVGRHDAGEELAGRDDALAFRTGRDHARVERDEHRRQIGCRIRMRDVAADRAAVPDRRIAHARRRFGKRLRRRDAVRPRPPAPRASSAHRFARRRPAATIPRSSATRPMSMTADGAASRSFSSGTRL